MFPFHSVFLCQCSIGSVCVYVCMYSCMHYVIKCMHVLVFPFMIPVSDSSFPFQTPVYMSVSTLSAVLLEWLSWILPPVIITCDAIILTPINGGITIPDSCVHVSIYTECCTLRMVIMDPPSSNYNL